MPARTPLVALMGAAVLMLTLAPGPAVAADAASADAPRPAGAQTAGGAAAQARAPGVPDIDRRFMMKAAGGGLYELQVSQLALEKATRDEVRAFARMLVDDHTEAHARLQALARRKGVKLPEQPPREKQSRIAALKKLSGDKFDKAYIQRVGIEDHQQDVKMFEQEVQDAKDPDVQQFASTVLPVLANHLQRAREIAR